MDNWIKVKDQLPESHNETTYWFHGLRVFFELDGSKHNVDAQWTKNDLFVWHGMNITKYVTHWQENPRPPK